MTFLKEFLLSRDVLFEDNIFLEQWGSRHKFHLRNGIDTFYK